MLAMPKLTKQQVWTGKQCMTHLGCWLARAQQCTSGIHQQAFEPRLELQAIRQGNTGRKGFGAGADTALHPSRCAANNIRMAIPSRTSNRPTSFQAAWGCAVACCRSGQASAAGPCSAAAAE